MSLAAYSEYVVVIALINGISTFVHSSIRSYGVDGAAGLALDGAEGLQLDASAAESCGFGYFH